MSEQVTNYQCPACTGPLHYVGSSDKLECDYCGASYDVSEIEALYAEKEKKAEQRGEHSSAQGEWDASGINSDWGTDASGMKAYSCPSCGAELICDASTAATSCPYCGNPTIVPGQFSGALKPDYVIPFKLSKEDAIDALKRHYSGKPFLPKPFVSGNHIQEIQGVYVPFWLFDGTASGDASYEATRSRVLNDGDYEVTQIDHFRVYRAGSVEFEKVPVNASGKMSDDYMDSIEPYDYGGLKPFSPAYLPGFMADKFDMTVEQCRSRADIRCQNTLETALRSTVDQYSTCVRVGGNTELHRGKIHYALMPVWILNTKWNGKNYMFAVNGQTGRLAGDLPMSWGRFWAGFAAIAVPLSVLGTVLSILLAR